MDVLDKRLVPMIRKLREHYKIAVLSNATSEEINPNLDKHRHHELFDHIAVSSEIGAIKPEPAAFQHVLDKLGVRASEAIFIDDNPANVVAAEQLGLTGIVYTDFSALRSMLKKLKVKC